MPTRVWTVVEVQSHRRAAIGLSVRHHAITRWDNRWVSRTESDNVHHSATVVEAAATGDTDQAAIQLGDRHAIHRTSEATSSEWSSWIRQASGH